MKYGINYYLTISVSEQGDFERSRFEGPVTDPCTGSSLDKTEKFWTLVSSFVPTFIKGKFKKNT